MSIQEEILQQHFTGKVHKVLTVDIYAEAENVEILEQFFRDEFGAEKEPTTPFMDNLAGRFIHGTNRLLREWDVKARVVTAVLDMGSEVPDEPGVFADELCPRCGIRMQATHYPLCQERDGTPTELTDELVRKGVALYEEILRYLEEVDGTKGDAMHVVDLLRNMVDIGVEDADDYFGVCPTCGKSDGHLNNGRHHWGICHTHKVRWYIGSNLFSAWKDETPEEQAEQRALLKTYKDVTEWRSIEPTGV